MEFTRLILGLSDLGAMLDATGSSMEIAIVGGAAMRLAAVHNRPTEDIDVVALRDGVWSPSSPLPDEVLRLVIDVGRTHDLPLRAHGSEHDWLNASTSFLMPDDLPDGFFSRTTVRRFSALALHVPAREDLVYLKLLSATRAGRGTRRAVDVSDLVSLAPTAALIAEGLTWVAARRPDPDFWPGRAQVLLDDLEAAGLGDAVAAVRAQLSSGEAGP